MYIFISILILAVSILLGLIVLVQNPKGGGLASGFTGGAAMGGVQRTTDFLEKSTWYLVVALFVTCMAAGIYNGNTEANVGIDESFMPSTTSTPAPDEVAAPIEAESPTDTPSE